MGGLRLASVIVMVHEVKAGVLLELVFFHCCLL
jgi:hypothetical protein